MRTEKYVYLFLFKKNNLLIFSCKKSRIFAGYLAGYLVSELTDYAAGYPAKSLSCEFATLEYVGFNLNEFERYMFPGPISGIFKIILFFYIILYYVYCILYNINYII